MNAPAGLVVDHIDRDVLNNSRSNLRVCTQGNNARNRKAVNVYDVRDFFPNAVKPWQARFMLNNKNVHVGMFATKEEGQRAVAAKKRELYGQFAPKEQHDGIED